MSNIQYHGTTEQEADSVCFVSYWYLPGGYDAVNACVCKRYFSDIEEAEKVEKKYCDYPEMACIEMIVKGE